MALDVDRRKIGHIKPWREQHGAHCHYSNDLESASFHFVTLNIILIRPRRKTRTEKIDLFPLLQQPSKVNRARGSIDISTPMMLVDWILLIQIDLEELVVVGTLPVLEAGLMFSLDLETVSGSSYELSFWKFAWIRSASVISLKTSSSSLDGMK